jgi:hypothetical protein
MTWISPPSAVDTMRTMLLASSSFTGAGFISASVHYPAAAIETDDATAVDTLPVCVLAEESQERTRYAEGARGLPGGVLSIVLHSDTDAGTLETLARNIVDDLILTGQSTGLPIRGGRVGLCSDPTEGQRAADVTDTNSTFRSISISIEYGLTV